MGVTALDELPADVEGAVGLVGIAADDSNPPGQIQGPPADANSADLPTGELLARFETDPVPRNVGHPHFPRQLSLGGVTLENNPPRRGPRQARSPPAIVGGRVALGRSLPLWMTVGRHAYRIGQMRTPGVEKSDVCELSESGLRRPRLRLGEELIHDTPQGDNSGHATVLVHQEEHLGFFDVKDG